MIKPQLVFGGLTTQGRPLIGKMKIIIGLHHLTLK